MKHFLGSCQQNRHLRQRQTERETGREREGERKEGRERRDHPQVLERGDGKPWRDECRCAGQPGHALGARLRCQGAACTGQRQAGLGGRGRRSQGAHPARSGRSVSPGSPTLVVGHTWPPHSSLLTRALAQGLGCSQNSAVQDLCACGARSEGCVGVAHFKSPCHTQNHITRLYHGINPMQLLDRLINNLLFSLKTGKKNGSLQKTKQAL